MADAYNPYAGQTLSPYEPTWRDRLASMMLGEQPSFEKRKQIEGLLGSSGLGDTGMSLVDFTGLGGLLDAQTQAAAGDYRSAAMAMVPGMKQAKAVVKPIEAAAETVARKLSPQTYKAAAQVAKRVNITKPESITKYALEGGAVPEEIDALPELIAQIRDIQKQRQNTAFFSSPERDPLYRGPDAQWSELNRAIERNKNVSQFTLMPGFDLLRSDAADWIKTFAHSTPAGAFDETKKAAMETIPRLLKKEGWGVRHISQGKNKRASSRYLVSPDKKYEVRLSDHDLPDTPQRQYSREQRGPRWDDEFVLDRSLLRKGIPGLLDDIKSGYAEHLDDIKSGYAKHLDDIKSGQPINSAKEAAKFVPLKGDVYHPRYGKGTVISSQPDVAEIDFGSNGVMKILSMFLQKFPFTKTGNP